MPSIPLTKYVLTVGITSTEHPADLIEHVRAALEGATGISSVLEIAPLPIAPSPSPSAPAIPRRDDDEMDEGNEIDDPAPKKKHK